jgi:molybdate transport system substrate-binding protein
MKIEPMQPRLILSSVTLFASLSALGLAPMVARAESTSLTISVAASLQDAISALQPLYEEKNPDIELVINFGSSGSLQQQIEQGAPVDLFISAAARQMNALAEKGLILPETETILVTNELVLITPINSPLIEKSGDLTQPDIERIALGEPSSVPAGTYAQQALTALDLISELESKFVFGKDVRQVLNYVETDNVDVGIVYQTDALVSDKVKVSFVFPPETHEPIVYPMAVIKGSDHPEAAGAFAEFLKGEAAERVWEEFGFKAAK